MQQVKNYAGAVEIPSNVKDTVLNGLGQSILGSLTQTATKPSGLEQIKSLLTGASSAASSPITALAGSLFTKNILSKLNLGSVLNSSLTGLIPKILGGLSNFIKDQDGDGDVDLNDILLTLKGGNKTQAQKSGGGILGSILGKVLGGTR